jgi:hypothetical protein
MSDFPNKPVPSLAELEESVSKLLEERVLSKGGTLPNPKVHLATIKYLALKAFNSRNVQ